MDSGQTPLSPVPAQWSFRGKWRGRNDITGCGDITSWKLHGCSKWLSRNSPSLYGSWGNSRMSLEALTSHKVPLPHSHLQKLSWCHSTWQPEAGCKRTPCDLNSQVGIYFWWVLTPIVHSSSSIASKPPHKHTHSFKEGRERKSSPAKNLFKYS